MSVSASLRNLEPIPPDVIFHMKTLYDKDKSPNKTDLGIGAYRNDEGQPWVLPVVRTVESQMSSDDSLNHEYLPIDGLKAFSDSANRLLLGEDSCAVTENRCCGVQTVSGTGALRLAFEFLYEKCGGQRTVLLSDPTWANHPNIVRKVGYTDIKKYRYWDGDNRKLDITGLLEDLQAAPEGSIVVLQTCGHNPTGVDPSKEEWKLIASVCQERRLFPIFDTAYQGFATGNLDNDACSIREFVSRGMELFATQSFSKNFGLYNERVGNLCCVMSSTQTATALRSHLKFLCRRLWSNPPNHGARIVATVLNNPALKADWLENIITMSSRIKMMREELHKLLRIKGTPGNWDHVISQIGMFCYTGLNEKQVDVLINKYHIYLSATGRVSISGLNTGNIEYVAGAIDDVVRNVPTVDGKSD